MGTGGLNLFFKRHIISDWSRSPAGSLQAWLPCVPAVTIALQPLTRCPSDPAGGARPWFIVGDDVNGFYCSQAFLWNDCATVRWFMPTSLYILILSKHGFSSSQCTMHCMSTIYIHAIFLAAKAAPISRNLSELRLQILFTVYVFCFAISSFVVFVSIQSWSWRARSRAGTLESLMWPISEAWQRKGYIRGNMSQSNKSIHQSQWEPSNQTGLHIKKSLAILGWCCWYVPGLWSVISLIISITSTSATCSHLQLPHASSARLFSILQHWRSSLIGSIAGETLLIGRQPRCQFPPSGNVRQGSWSENELDSPQIDLGNIQTV